MRRAGIALLERCVLLGLGLVVGLGACAEAAQAIGSEQAPSDSLLPHVVTLRDGSVLRGRIVSQDDQTVVLESPALGRLILRCADIESIKMGTLGRVRELWSLDPDYNSVMLGPTPATLPRGKAYFRGFELILLNFGVGVTDALNLSFGSVFPISADLFGEEMSFSLTGFRPLMRDDDSDGFIAFPFAQFSKQW